VPDYSTSSTPEVLKAGQELVCNVFRCLQVTSACRGKSRSPCELRPAAVSH